MRSTPLGRVLVVGATSAIAQASARQFAVDGARLFLVARDAAKLAAVTDDLRARGAAQVESYLLDVTETDHLPAMLAAARASLGEIDGVLVAHGTLPDQRACEQDVALAQREFTNNGLSVMLLLTVLGQYFETRSTGCLAVITSVAGDRGRASNYVYGSAKAAVATFLQGLRGRLVPRGVAVLTVKPGFVDTPMTAALPHNPLFVSADYAGVRIHDAMQRGRSVVYIPWFWRWIMLALRLVPEPLFRRLRL